MAAPSLLMQLMFGYHGKMAEETHRCVWFHWAVKLHGCTTLLYDFGVLPMETSLLVLLHSRNFLFQPESDTVNIAILCRFVAGELTSSLRAYLCQHPLSAPDYLRGSILLQGLVAL